MKILVLGSNGQLGRCLCDQLEQTELEVIYSSRTEIDIGDLIKTEKEIVEINPDVVINASAYSLVDKAESEPKLANLINHVAVGNLSEVCERTDSSLIHFSTDYVFDGNASIPYTEDAETNPQGVYGKTKLLGELAISRSGCKHVIIRTAWLFSEYGNNFLKTMLRLGAERDEIKVVDDEIGCPTYAQDIAKNTISIFPMIENGSFTSGIYHYCGNAVCSWYKFAEVIFSLAAKRGLPVPDSLVSISTSDYPTPAKRPKYSALNTLKFTSTFFTEPSNLDVGIAQAIDNLATKLD